MEDREIALGELSKKREAIPDLATMLWCVCLPPPLPVPVFVQNLHQHHYQYDLIVSTALENAATC